MIPSTGDGGKGNIGCFLPIHTNSDPVEGDRGHCENWIDAGLRVNEVTHVT
jgi:hypothetical protein